MNNIVVAVLFFSLLGAIFGALLGFFSIHFKVLQPPIIEQIHSALPQTQCAQCGYPGCLPYANAVFNNNEMINKCIPGGEKTMLKLSDILKIKPQKLQQTKVEATLAYKVAWIDEAYCIGCNKCIKICPVDAIVGLKGSMHTVLRDTCTGCNLCISPCPMDCITMCTLSIKNITYNKYYKKCY